jgi:hypothetical protein
MISLPNQQPLLSVGDLPLAPCEEEWLHLRIQDAALAAGRGDFWVARDIARGVMDYLERDYKGTVIALPALLDRVRALLHRLDCADVAAHLDASPPPLTLALPQLATDAGNGFELAFFSSLRHRLLAGQAHGIREVRLSGLRLCVQSLRGAAKWRKDCESLAREILDFIRQHQMAPSVIAP